MSEAQIKFISSRLAETAIEKINVLGKETAQSESNNYREMLADLIGFWGLSYAALQNYDNRVNSVLAD